MSQPKHLVQEADIGSGERDPGQQETDKMIEQVPPDRPAGPNDTRNQPGRTQPNGMDAPSKNSP